MRSVPHLQSLVIVGLLLILIVGLQLRIFTGEDIAIAISPNKISINTTTQAQEEITFTISKTRAWCEAACTYSFTGRDTLKEDSFTFNTYHDLVFTIRAPDIGFGQDVYNLHMECTNIKTLWCRTSGERIEESRLVLVHYELEKPLQEKINQIKRDLIGTYERLIILTEHIRMLQEWNKVGTYTQQLHALEKNTQNNITRIQEYTALYGEQEFETLAGKYIPLSIEELEKQVYAMHQNIEHITGVHNTSINYVKSLAPYVQDVYLLTQDTNILKQFLETGPYINLNISQLNNTLHSAALIQEQKNKIQEEALKNELEHICGWFLEVCTTKQVQEMLKEEKNNIPLPFSATQRMQQLCMINETGFFGVMQQAYAQKLNQTIASWFKENGVEEWYENKTLYGQVVQQANAWQKNSSIESFFRPIFPLLISYKANQRTCTSVPAIIKQLYLQPITTKNYTASIIKQPLSIQLNRTLDIQDAQAMCCARGSCKPCCIGQECNTAAMYPLLLVHGHVLNARSVPEYSLDGFVKLQRALEDEGYVNGGILLPRTQRSLLDAFPFSFRTTYYVDVILENGTTYVPANSQSITTYALRLKDIIDTAKEETRKDKVIIIAHSMGGLVARQYLQTFGEDSVHMLIMIGTPNEGITENILHRCNILGEKQECTEMTQGSIFLRKLASSKLTLPTHVIIGAGCPMRQGDSDGVVLTQAASLPGAVEHTIQGTCTASEPLHTEMLNPEKYPALIKIISSILPLQP